MNLYKRAALLETAVVAGAAHIAQNAIANHTLLTRRGGKSIVSNVLGGDQKSRFGHFVNGVKNIIPEKPILENEIKHIIEKIPDLSNRDRVALYEVSQGNFDKPFVINHIKINPKLQEMLSKYGLKYTLMHSSQKTLSSLKEIYKNNRLGDMFSGVGEELRHTPLSAIKEIPNSNKYNQMGEIGANAIAGIHEPVVPIINGVKRFFAKKSKTNPTNVIDKTQKAGKDFVSEKVVEKPMEKAIQEGASGKKETKALGVFKTYGLNPVTAAAQKFGRDVAAIAKTKLNF